MNRRVRLLSAFSLWLALLLTSLRAQPVVMLAWVQPREAALWVQTDEDAILTWRVQAAGQESHTVGPVLTTPAQAFTQTLIVSGLTAATDYAWQLEVNGEAVGIEGRFQTTPVLEADATPPPVTVLVGGALWCPDPPHDGLGDLGEWQPDEAIFAQMVAAEPDLVLWAGPSAPLREADWTSPTGVERRMTHARQHAGWQALLRAAPQQAVAQAADLGPPQADRWHPLRAPARELFQRAWPRPQGDRLPYGSYRLADAEFFLLDTASNREKRPDAPGWNQLMGDGQLQWLERALNLSSARWKFIVAGSPLLNPVEAADHLVAAREEHRRFLRILETAAPGIVLLSGGRAIGEATRLPRHDAYPLLEVSVGPTTGLPLSREDHPELNYYRVPTSLTEGQQFLQLDFTGPTSDRELQLSLLTVSREVAWRTRLTLADLSD